VAGGQSMIAIGAEKTASGYEVALFNTSTHLYTIWNTDNSGNKVSTPISNAAGTSAALESLETSFHQDLNNDGVMGVPAAVHDTMPNAHLVDLHAGFFL
jgi:hypothetical protein